MAKAPNIAESSTIRISLSTQSVALLAQLAEMGIYGRNAAEVAARFVDQALQNFVETPQLTINAKGGRADG